MILFHIAEKNKWEESLKSGLYGDFSIEKDGFIHCSEFNQLLHVANNNLKSVNEKLVVLCIDSNRLKSEIKWEINRNNGITFPHIYGLINVDSVIDTVDFEKNLCGDYFISDKLLSFSNCEKSCGAIIFHKFNNEYKVLLIRFIYNDELRWGFPKGHVEDQETEIQTAIREIKEEVGLDVEIIPGFRMGTHFSLKQGVREVVYYCAETKLTKTIPQKGEVEEVGWFNFEDAYSHLTYDCDKNILNCFIKFFRKLEKNL